MMHPLDYLHEIGLSKSEAKLYIAGLELGETGVAMLVYRTGIKRPTAYHALNQLVAKDLAVETKTGKELVYVMRQPDNLTRYIDSKLGDLSRSAAQLTEVIDLFPSVVVQPSVAPVQHFVGSEQIKRALDKALHCKTGTWDIIAPISNFVAENTPSYIEYFKTTRKKRGIVSRTLWEGQKGQTPVGLYDIVDRKPRYLPPKYQGKFSSMLILFDSSVLLVGLNEAVLMESKDIFDLQAILFDSLWSGAVKP